MPLFKNAYSYAMPTMPTFNTGNYLANQQMINLAKSMAQGNARRSAGQASAYGNQNRAVAQAQNLINQHTALQNKANQQIESRQKASERLFAGLMDQYQNDPMYRTMKNSVYNWMQNPGLSQSTLRRLQQQAQARAAADLASNQRNIDAASARTGMTGPMRNDAIWAAKSRSNSALNRSMLDIDLRNEQMRTRNIGQAAGMMNSMLNSRYGNLANLAGRYANVMQSYNPQVAPLNVYDMMSSVFSNPSYGVRSPGINPYSFMTADPGGTTVPGSARRGTVARKRTSGGNAYQQAGGATRAYRDAMSRLAEKPTDYMLPSEVDDLLWQYGGAVNLPPKYPASKDPYDDTITAGMYF